MSRRQPARPLGSRAVIALVAVRAVGRRPDLWPEAVRVLARLAPRRWWRRPPFLPLPTREYLAFRLLTQYGAEQARPASSDVVSYLEWSRRL